MSPTLFQTITESLNILLFPASTEKCKYKAVETCILFSVAAARCNEGKGSLIYVGGFDINAL